MAACMFARLENRRCLQLQACVGLTPLRMRPARSLPQPQRWAESRYARPGCSLPHCNKQQLRKTMALQMLLADKGFKPKIKFDRSTATTSSQQGRRLPQLSAWHTCAVCHPACNHQSLAKAAIQGLYRRKGFLVTFSVRHSRLSGM